MEKGELERTYMVRCATCEMLHITDQNSLTAARHNLVANGWHNRSGWVCPSCFAPKTEQKMTLHKKPNVAGVQLTTYPRISAALCVIDREQKRVTNLSKQTGFKTYNEVEHWLERIINIYDLHRLYLDHNDEFVATRLMANGLPISILGTSDVSRKSMMSQLKADLYSGKLTFYAQPTEMAEPEAPLFSEDQMLAASLAWHGATIGGLHVDFA